MVCVCECDRYVCGMFGVWMVCVCVVWYVWCVSGVCVWCVYVHGMCGVCMVCEWGMCVVCLYGVCVCVFLVFKFAEGDFYINTWPQIGTWSWKENLLNFLISVLDILSF